MSNTPIDVLQLGLDPLGRVVLTDDILDTIDESVHIVSAGANSESCQGTSNGSCTNSTWCSDTSNGWCTNSLSCSGSGNVRCVSEG